MKGVILAGAPGPMHPLTRITNKHLLPIYDRPMVTYAIETLVSAGITELMVVTGGTHAGEFLRLLGNGHEYGIDRLLYAYQERPGGIAEALGLTERFVDGDRVVVMLADNMVERSLRPAVTNFAAKIGARIVLARIDDPAHLRHRRPKLDGDGRVVRILEKPDDPPSNYVVTGIYFYDEHVFDVIPTLQPSGRGGGDHRRQQLVRRAAHGVRRPRRLLGRRRRGRSTPTTRSTTSSASGANKD